MSIFVFNSILRSSRETLSWSQALQWAGCGNMFDQMNQVVAVARKRLQIAKIPVIGVVGQLNAGKSSVVAMFLSEAAAGACLAVTKMLMVPIDSFTSCRSVAFKTGPCNSSSRKFFPRLTDSRPKA